MNNRLAAGAAAAVAVFALAACTGHSAGVTVQSGPAAATSTSPAVTTPAAPATTTRTAATPGDPSTPPPVTTSTVTTSTVTTPLVSASTPSTTSSAAGKAALAAFMAFDKAYANAQRSPTPSNQAAVTGHLTSPSVAGISADLANQRAAGLVYKGKPDDPRVHVVSPVISPTLVFLRSCPLIDRKSPFLPYFAATGKPALPGGRTGPRWWRDIAVVKVGGSWKIKTYSVDENQPCNA